jgi:hypothetical protein
MPVHTGSDAKGKFYQWGTHGKKYYYTTERSKQIAFKKAQRQGIAIYASGYKENIVSGR